MSAVPAAMTVTFYKCVPPIIKARSRQQSYLAGVSVTDYRVICLQKYRKQQSANV